MNYRHIYHAGNFADVMKHHILAHLLQKLREKETPFAVLDTHAGAGIYDLQSVAAQKTGEYKEGIALLMRNPEPAFQPYLETVRYFCHPGECRGPDPAIRRDDTLRFYPGSAAIIRQLLRPQDRLIACELHPEDAASLKQYFYGDKQATIHHQNGYHALKAFLPFKEKRGLVLIDPPFEAKDEFTVLLEGVKTAYHRFSQGIYAIWYPLKDRAQVEKFHRALSIAKIPKTLIAELWVAPESQGPLSGCGMAIINPPWKLDMALKIELQTLGTTHTQWLAN